MHQVEEVPFVQQLLSGHTLLDPFGRELFLWVVPSPGDAPLTTWRDESRRLRLSRPPASAATGPAMRNVNPYQSGALFGIVTNSTTTTMTMIPARTGAAP